jgi:prepilin-type N-terminal cleavage/methylation domain-containing protein
MDSKKGFSLVELLVVIAIIASLLSMLMPSLSRARLQAKILTVNVELHDIGTALEAYSVCNNNKFPPTRADCNPSTRIYSYSLPQELVKGNYLPGGSVGKIRFAKIEDKFNPGYTYKYISPGPMYDYKGAPGSNQSLWVPLGFPANMSGKPIEYDNTPKKGISPVSWTIFSVGPDYPVKELADRTFPLSKGFPVCREFWFDSKAGKGILARIKMLNHSDHVGTFGIGR